MEGWGINILLTAVLRSWVWFVLPGLLLCAPVFAEEQVSTGQPNQQLPLEEAIVKPEVVRRNIGKVAIDSENLELGYYGGFYAAERFGTNPVTGLRVSFHVSEDIFFEATTGETTTEPTFEEQLIGFFTVADEDRRLTYYNLNLGYNMLPGEVFFGRNWAFNFAFYILAGVGSTDFLGERHATVVTGAGMRILLTDWMALHIDVRDHVFRVNPFGIATADQTTHNIESVGSLTFFF